MIRGIRQSTRVGSEDFLQRSRSMAPGLGEPVTYTLDKRGNARAETTSSDTKWTVAPSRKDSSLFDRLDALHRKTIGVDVEAVAERQENET